MTKCKECNHDLVWDDINSKWICANWNCPANKSLHKKWNKK